MYIYIYIYIYYIYIYIYICICICIRSTRTPSITADARGKCTDRRNNKRHRTARGTLKPLWGDTVELHPSSVIPVQPLTA